MQKSSDEYLGEFLLKSMDLIPKDCEEDREIITKLRNKFVYTAPEARGLLWKKVYLVCVQNFANDDISWHQDLKKLWEECYNKAVENK